MVSAAFHGQAQSWGSITGSIVPYGPNRQFLGCALGHLAEAVRNEAGALPRLANIAFLAEIKVGFMNRSWGRGLYP